MFPKLTWLALLCATICTAQPLSWQQRIEANERHELDCLKTGNYDEFASLLADDAETGTSHGKPFSATVHVSALWAERGGRWLCLFSQETAARAR